MTDNREAAQSLYDEVVKRVTTMTLKGDKSETVLITAFSLGIAAVGALFDIADAVRELEGDDR